MRTPTVATPRLQIWPAALAGELRLHLGLLALVIVATWLGFNTATPTYVPAVSDVRGLYGGVQAVEQSALGPYRWSDGAGRICLPEAGRAARSLLTVYLSGEYALALGTTSATLRPGAALSVTVALPPNVRRYTLLTGASQQAGDSICLAIESAAARDPNSDRALGVQIFGFAKAHLPAAGPVLPARGQLALNAALALAALWLMRLLGAPAWAAALIVGGAAVAVTAALLGGVVPAGANLFRFMLPVAGGVLAGVAGILGARLLGRYAPGLPRLARDLIGMLYWSAVLVGGVRALQIANGHQGAWPLKAGVDPNWTPLAILPAALCAGWLWLILRQGAPPDRAQGAAPPWRPAAGLLLVTLGAVAIPVALEVTVLGWDSLYAVFRDSPYDYQRDTWRVAGDPVGFLARYVAMAPEMALHTSTHPPGSVLLLWAVEQVAGPGAVATSWTAIVLSALLVLAALWLGWRLEGPRLALLAGAIAALMPGHMVYAVTSMDGIFNGLNALAAAAFFLCLEPPARPRMAALAGALIALGLFFTYATTQLFFLGLAAALFAIYRRARGGGAAGQGGGGMRGWTRRAAALWEAACPVLRQGLTAAGTIVAIYLAIYLATGFNVIVASREATAENALEMGRAIFGQVRQPFAPPSFAYYLDFLGANAAAYLWYLAPWGLAALSSLLLAGVARGRAPGAYDALLVSAGCCVLGMLLSGLFNREVERIWAFTYPLAAVLIARHALQGDAREQRWRALLFPALFFAQSAVIKMLLNTAW